MGGGSWKVAYADFTTAMMSFFLLMWLLNVVDDETKNGLSEYFQSDANFSSNNVSPISDPNNPLVQYVDKLDQREFKVDEIEQSHYAIAQALKQTLMQDALMSAASGVSTDSIGVLLAITSDLVFKPGTVELTDEGKRVLHEVIAVMSKYKVYLIVRGHADSSESGRPFASKWDLSAARANVAVSYLISQGINPKLVRSVAYSDTMPLVPPTVAGAAKKNARVEFNFHRPEVMSTIMSF